MSKSRRKNSSLMANVKTEYFLWFCYWKPVNLFCSAFEWQNRLANRSSLTSKFTLKCPIQFSFEEDSWGKFLSSYNRRLSLSFIVFLALYDPEQSDWKSSNPIRHSIWYFLQYFVWDWYTEIVYIITESLLYSLFGRLNFSKWSTSEHKELMSQVD